MEGGLSKELIDRLDRLDISRPYVWELKLSMSDFKELEIWVNGIVVKDGCDSLTDAGNALYTLIYIAEWYKREYQSGNKIEWINDVDLDTLWRNVGLNKQFLYKDDNGKERRLYSIYVLGGLAIRHELNRSDNLRFFKSLCRIYHGEDCSLEYLNDAARAIAFRESIKQQHALYEFIRVLLNGELPFSNKDSDIDSSLVQEFVLRLESANKEVLREKFRFEWLVTFSPDNKYMTRRLNIWLKPEQVGGGQHAYLRNDRLHVWGVKDLDNQLRLFVHIRFLNRGVVIEPSTMNKPILTFLYHGVNDFVACLVNEYVQIKDIPASRFDTIEILIKDESGNEYVAQTQKTTEYIQLWEKDSLSSVWTSTQHVQRDTVLLFSRYCELSDQAKYEEVYQKRFRSKLFGVGEYWNWIYIHDSVSFLDEHGRALCLYNRQGLDQVSTKLYKQIIHYVRGGKVLYSHVDDQNENMTCVIDELPLIFCRDDIVVHHFATKDDVSKVIPASEAVVGLITFKQPNGTYTEWDSFNEPSHGVVQLKVTVKGRVYALTVIYLPRLEKEHPIKRVFSDESILYRGLDGTVCVYKDCIPLDKVPLSPTVSIQFGSVYDYVTIEVYRPTVLMEVLLDGVIIDYLDGKQPLSLPYIFKERVRFNSWNENGYQSYDCKRLGNIYRKEFIDLVRNGTVSMAARAAWKSNLQFMGSMLDPQAPSWLRVGFGKSEGDTNWEGQIALFWNYDQRVEPMVCDPGMAFEGGIVFQDLSRCKDLTCNHPILDDNWWALEDNDISIFRCFEVAMEKQIYFFIMYPLLTLRKEKIKQEIYDKLIEVRCNHLTEQDKRALRRLGEEFDLDWAAFGVQIDND